MKKRALSLLLALVLVFGLLPVTAQAGELDNGLTYEVCKDYYGNVYMEITGYTGDAADLVIPAEIEGLPVVSIKQWGSFDNCPTLRTISLPATLTEISGNPFYGCPNLVAVYVDEANPEFCNSQDGCLLTKDKTCLLIVPGSTSGVFTIPDGVDTITVDTFDACSQITTIVVNADVTMLGKVSYGYGIDSTDRMAYSVAYAFASCTNLVRFDVDSQNSVYASDNAGALYTKDYSTLLCVPVGTKGSYTIAKNPSTIDAWSFFKCKHITSVFIPSSVSHLEQSAFYGCDELKELYFIGDAPIFDIIEYSDWVGNIKNGAFYNITANLYYPADNETWGNAIAYADGHISGDGVSSIKYIYDYGGNITWIPYSAVSFTDVPNNSFYSTPVLWALANGITTGASDTTFNPNGSCLRAQVVTFLHRADGNPAPTSTNNPFTDVKSSDFFYKSVLWAVEQGITNGISATEFGSYATCNRAAVVTFLWRAAGEPEPESTANPFTDVKSGDFFYKPVLWAIENGITNGIDATHFGPTAACNRAQVVTFLYRAYN